MSTFGERLKFLRKNRGLSQDSFAMKFGLTSSTIGMYEKGYREPNLEKLNQFADFFGVTIDYLVGRTNNPNQEYKAVTREFLDMLHLSDEEIYEKGPHTLDDRVLTREEFMQMITLIRMKRQLEQQKFPFPPEQ